MPYEQYFPPNLLGNPIFGFPYVERFCRFCDQPCELVKAIHLQSEPEHYKALFMCQNTECGAYDEDSAMQYARVYYSSDEAFRALEMHRIYYPVQRKT